MTSPRSHVFTYGTLMFHEVWSRVVRGRYERVPGTLAGYVRRRVKGQSYPGLYPARREDLVRGIIYRDVAPEDVARLNEFEGELYETRHEECLSEDGSVLPVIVYVFKPEHRELLDESEWDPAWFVREGMPGFLGHYVGFSGRS